MASLRTLQRRYGGTITIGERRFRRFIPYPGPVTDDTGRCIKCGQIDEPDYHIPQACLDAVS